MHCSVGKSALKELNSAPTPLSPWSRCADTTLPALEPDGATVFTDELTLTYNEALKQDSVPAKEQFEVSLDGGTAEAPTDVAVSGSTVTLTLATPAAHGQTVTVTYTVPGSNPLQDLAGNAAEKLENYEVENKTIVLPVVSIEAEPGAKAAPLLAPDAVFKLRTSPAPMEDLEVTLKITQAGAYLASEMQTVTIPKYATEAIATFQIAPHYTLASGDLMAMVEPGERRYVPAPAPANAATVQVVVVNPPIVAQWSENEYEVDEGKDATATLTLKMAAGVPRPRADYKVKVFTTNHTAGVGVEDEVDDYTAVSDDPPLTVQPGDWSPDGGVLAVSVPVTMKTLQDRVLEDKERFRLQVSAADGQAPLGLECPDGLKNQGGAGRCATEIVIEDNETLGVATVEVTSTPAGGMASYLEGEIIEFTVTFTAKVTVTGTPAFTFLLGPGTGEETRVAAYVEEDSSEDALVFRYTVKAGEVDRDGISWRANALAIGEGGTFRQKTTDPDNVKDADLEHSAQREGLTGHRVDADPPGLVEDAPATMTGTVLTLVYDEKLDENSRPAPNAYSLTVNSVTSPPTSVVIGARTTEDDTVEGIPMLVGEPDPDPWPPSTALLPLLASAGATVEGLFLAVFWYRGAQLGRQRRSRRCESWPCRR